jgi:hypothetical protein
MDEVERLIQAFSKGGGMCSTALKLDLLMDLERLRDRRVVSFLLQVLRETAESSEVRMHVLRRLRNGPLTVEERSSAAHAMGELMLDGSSIDLQLQAALALGAFADIPGVPTVLGSLALDPAELLDLRYSAFTSLERAGPTPECINLLRQLSEDELLGRSAQSALVYHRRKRTAISESGEQGFRHCGIDVGGLTKMMSRAREKSRANAELTLTRPGCSPTRACVCGASPVNSPHEILHDPPGALESSVGRVSALRLRCAASVGRHTRRCGYRSRPARCPGRRSERARLSTLRSHLPCAAAIPSAARDLHPARRPESGRDGLP